VPRFGLPEPDSEIVHTFYPLLAGSIMEAQMRSDDEGDTGSGALSTRALSFPCHLPPLPAYLAGTCPRAQPRTRRPRGGLKEGALEVAAIVSMLSAVTCI
jgi:hypothetical protein